TLHRSSIIGTPMPPAAAPYRASGLVRWREADHTPKRRCQLSARAVISADDPCHQWATLGITIRKVLRE
ncbi:hypothetical protein, partial [Bradyrhizobium sp. AUGA SZCCT0283]|uniref:hypothetical protein n=1 Tax=Bradyrhizobium sp. AUGA SZCCT0283 TaxID=2807671 RepID=UPI001BA71C3B